MTAYVLMPEKPFLLQKFLFVNTNPKCNSVVNKEMG